MDAFFFFDSKQEKYKKPFGAIVCGEEITLSAYALYTEILSVNVIFYSEYEKTEKHISMFWSDRKQEYDIYSLTLSVSDVPGIFWYYFEIHTTDNNIIYYGKNGIKTNADGIYSYQLTIYSSDYVTPSWFEKGVTYHIFVDRFNRGKLSSKITFDSDFYIHKDMSETPSFKPNKNGIVENNDIYGGDIQGIIEKLPYLNSLSVKTIYLSPIFEAWSNHKYNTANYKKIDSHFGDRSTLSRLCVEAAKYGMRVILDGVFSHVGSDSIYFNKEGRYGLNAGAWHDNNSIYSKWFFFGENRTYSSWWGIDTLPQVNELNEDYMDYIINDPDSVVATWMQTGISGWRLDVADELPDEFISELKKRSRSENREALVIGEVWEDASTKKAYGVNKKYFTTGVLDGVMNYPLKNLILDFLCKRISADEMKNSILNLIENYPIVSQRCLMNIIGTHDTIRAVNELSVGSKSDTTKEFRSTYVLCDSDLEKGKGLLRLAAVLQYMFPGSPCIYYGDEIGMQGFEDPFNRRYFTWSDIDKDLLSFYQRLGEIKSNVFDMQQSDNFKIIYSKKDIIAILRGNVIAFVNRGKKTVFFRTHDIFDLALEYGGCTITHRMLKITPNSCCILIKKNKKVNE